MPRSVNISKLISATTSMLSSGSASGSGALPVSVQTLETAQTTLQAPGPSSGSTSGMVLTTGGEATAVGTDTLATGDVKGSLTQNGPVTVAIADATFSAAALSTDGTGAYTSASSFAEVSGADILVTSQLTFTTLTTVGDTTLATDTSKSTLVAIDLAGIDLPGGPLNIDIDTDLAIATAIATPSASSSGGYDGPELSAGNVALLQVDTIAQAPDTLIEVGSAVLTIEDQLSTVAASAVLAIG